MCASYGLQVTADELHDAFGTLDERGSAPALAEWLQQHAEKPVKPTGVHALNLNPIVREREREGEHRRTIDLAWWKLWVGGEPAKFPAINARVEKLLSSGAWSGPTKSRRALVPVTSYLEKGRSFELPEGLFALAGIYNVTQRPDDTWMVSYAIVTRPAAPNVTEIHDRMPLIVRPELYDDGLDPTRVGDQGLIDEVLAASDDPSRRLEVV